MLETDLDLENINWVPVGTSTSQFKGKLDGNGHTIRNLSIHGNSSMYVGLFGFMGSGGTVKNLKLENASITVDAPADMSDRYVAAVVGGSNSSNISNVSVTGQVTFNGTSNAYAGLLGGYLLNTPVSYVYVNGTVTSGGAYTGGLAGKLGGSPTAVQYSDVHATVDIRRAAASLLYAGTVAGEAVSGSKIQNVSAFGSFTSSTSGSSLWKIGGLVGRINSLSEITNSMASTSGLSSLAQGLCADIHGASYFWENSFWDSEVSQVATSCGNLGTGYDTNTMKQADTYAAWDPAIWSIQDGQYPKLIMPPAIVIDTSDLAADGSGTVHANGFTSDGSSVVVSKWTTGSQSGSAGLSFFQSGGTDFTGSFDIPGPGTYTVYMKNAGGGESLKTINVSSTELNSFSVKNADVTPNEEIPVSYDSSTFTYSGVVSPSVTSVKFAPEPAGSSATVVMKDDQWNLLDGDKSTGFTTTISGSGKHGFTFAVVNGETMKVYKLELYAASPLDVTLTPSTTGATGNVTVSIEASGDYNSVDAIRWAQGIHTIEDFADESFGHDLTDQISVEHDVSKAEFDVEENGDYTVYVRDAFSTSSVSTIRVENIVKDAPSISFGAPDPDEPTAGEVSVSVTVSVYGYENGNQLKEARWKPGQLTVDSFAGGAGTDLMSELTVTGAVYQGQLTVSENGWYTVYAIDLVGNEGVNSVKVTNIFPASSDLDGLALSHGDLTPAFSPSVVDYTAQVENNVSSVAVTPTPAESHSTVTVNGTPVSGGTPIDIPLVVGENAITIVVTALDGQTKTYTITVTRAAPSSSSDPEPDPSSGSAPDPASDQPDDIRVIVDGKPQEKIASGKSSKDREGRSVYTVTVDAANLSSQLEREGDRPNVLIPVEHETDKVSAVLTGDAVKALENKQAVLEIRTPNGNYKLPAVEMFIDRVSSRLGNAKDLSLIEVHVEIATSGEAQKARLEAASESGYFTIVAPPVEFTITASHNGETVTVDKFSSYVQREIPLPDGADPDKITTGVVVEPDGTVRHVPTKVILIDGKSYAQINSLTNSTYTVVWHPVEFDDVSNHWAKDAVNEMGSRMVIEGTGNGKFSPDRDITRAEFAAIIVRALGLKPDSGAGVFADVKETDELGSEIRTAYEYGLTNGYADGLFRPDDKITREQAMVILSRAMDITGLKAKLPGYPEDAALRAYADATQASGWAIGGIADCVRAGIVSGRNGSALAPLDFITRAEAAAMVERLLQKSDLI